MSKDIKVYIEDILESIAKIEEYTQGLSFEDFSKNTQPQDAVTRRLEIIGEAVKRIPTELKNKYPKISWKQIAGLRDVLIHEYAAVKLERLWKVVTDDLAELKNSVEKIAQELK